MTTFYIAKILGQDLMSRPLAGDFYNLIENSNDPEVIVDFSDVHFATRSFMDEFFVLFKDNMKKGKVRLENLPMDVDKTLKAVMATQKNKKKVRSDETIVKTKDIQDLENHFAVLTV